MKNDAEEKVSKFYNTVGWETENGITTDARRAEDLRKRAAGYVSKCRLRVLRHIPGKGENMLDMASGPVQYKEYIEYSKNFKKRYCIDLSSKALEDAKKKIGDHGIFLCGSFFDIALEKDFFDCAISMHTIYHIDKDKQEEAVRKLIEVVKPGHPVIIVYANPNSVVFNARRLIKKVKDFLSKHKSAADAETNANLYFFAHTLDWWMRFSNIADVKMLPWRSFSSHVQKILIPDNALGEKIFGILFALEDRFPLFFLKRFHYPMIILTKRPASSK